MKRFRILISYLLITVLITGMSDTVNVQPKHAGAATVTTCEAASRLAASQQAASQQSALSETASKDTTACSTAKDTDVISSISTSGIVAKDTQYPYAKLEQPAKIKGFECQLKDNVEFLPAQTRYNLTSAPVSQSGTGGSSSGNIQLQQMPSAGSTSLPSYLPGTKMMKFADDSFVPEKDKIYIDSNAQGSFKVIDDAVSSSGKVEAAVVKPSADEVFEGFVIPKQEIAMTKGNITEIADGVQLVNSQNNIKSMATGPADENQLPAADTSRNYHEFAIPSIVIYPFSGDKEDNEPPKGKEEVSPTPAPEETDAVGTSSGSSSSMQIKIKGGRIRIYEPTLVAEADWDGDFDLGFRSMKVESSVTVEGNLNFSKESCMRLYGYGVDFDSGTEIAGHKIAAHLGIGIYAVFGINGKITITAKVEQAGTIEGGVKGNFVGILLGTPSAVPYANYDSERFDVAIMLNAKIHAWAYVGPQVTLNILDFNLLTVQVWVGMEGDAVVDGEAEAGSSTAASGRIQMDLSLDFVVLFRAWVFGYPYEKYLVDLNIYKKTLSYQFGESAGDTTENVRNYSAVIMMDGADAYLNDLWGTASYYDELSQLKPMKNVPVDIKVTKANGEIRDYNNVATDDKGKFILKVPNLEPSDSVMVSVRHSDTVGDVVINYEGALEKAINPKVPFDVTIEEADGFNDQVVGSVSPATNPENNNKEYYTGDITVTIKDEKGKRIRRKIVKANRGKFTVPFSDTNDLSGGHKAYATLVFENTTKTSNVKEADLAALKMNVGCQVDGVEAADIVETIMNMSQDSNLVGSLGINAHEIEYAGTVTNLKGLRSYKDNVEINFTNTGGFSEKIPVKAGKDPSVSTFENFYGAEVMGDLGMLLKGITFTIEYEDMLKEVTFQFASNDSPTIVTGHVNPIDQILIDRIDSRINPVELVLSVGNSQMRVNGSFMPIDGTSNTSVMQIKGKTYVPAKAVMGALGGTFSYSSSSNKITLKLNDTTVVAYTGRKGTKVNGKSKALAAAPFKTGKGVVMIPSALLSDYFGCKTNWESKTGVLTISMTRTIKSETETPVTEETPWTGVWDSNYGTLLLVQKGTKVTGTYGSWENNYKIEGTVKNGKLTGTFEEDGETGNFSFTLKDDTFTGKYNYTSNDESGEWSGTKISEDFGTAKSDWGGVWNTDLGAMVLKQSGSSVSGIYQAEHSSIQGTVSGQECSGTLKEGSREGEFSIILESDGVTFTGEYRYDGDEEWTSFDGIRIK